MINLFKKITGISKLEEIRADATRALEEASLVKSDAENAVKLAESAIAEAKETKRLAEEAIADSKLSAKELATKRGEPWVYVLNTQMNPETMLYSYFELDWNDLFIKQLISRGYGADGDAEEDIVNRWYRQLVYTAASEQNIDMSDRNVGYLTINSKPIDSNLTELS